LPELLLPPPDFDPPLLELPPFFELPLLPLLLEPPLPDLPLLLLSFLLVGITSLLLIYCCPALGPQLNYTNCRTLEMSPGIH